MATEIKECCENCLYWNRHEEQAGKPIWGLCGLCTGTRALIMNHYIRPVPEKLETVAMFSSRLMIPVTN